ncbi:hypothetical protein U1Q18_031608 [Sarracenia purpurea var. burkii]
MQPMSYTTSWTIAQLKPLKWEYKHPSSGSPKKVTTSFLACYHVQNILFRHKIVTMMKEIIENLSTIADEQRKFHLWEAAAEEKGVELVRRRETSSLFDSIAAVWKR